MKYPYLLRLISRNTGYHSDVIRDVLTSFAQAVTFLKAKEEVKTPLGIFFADQREPKENWHLPDGSTCRSPGTIKIKLRPHWKLKFKDTDPKWKYFFEDSNEESSEDSKPNS